jgi:cytochrome c5
VFRALGARLLRLRASRTAHEITPRQTFMRRSLSTPAAALTFAICVAFSVVAGLLVLHGSDDQRHHVTVLGQRVQLTADQSFGHQVFAQHCAVCHMLAASNSVGGTGPDLDAVHPSMSMIEQTVQNGKTGAKGTMPAGLATGPELDAVAAYVSHVANPNAYKP